MFKVCGVVNVVFSFLDDEVVRGVVIYFSGNYGICFSYVVGCCGIFCIVVMFCMVL